VRAFATAIVRLISPFHRSRPTYFSLTLRTGAALVVVSTDAPHRRVLNRLSNHTPPPTASI
jgi:hypothetical protein